MSKIFRGNFHTAPRNFVDTFTEVWCGCAELRCRVAGAGRQPRAGGGAAAAAGHVRAHRLFQGRRHLLRAAAHRVPALAHPPRHQKALM